MGSRIAMRRKWMPATRTATNSVGPRLNPGPNGQDGQAKAGGRFGGCKRLAILAFGARWAE